MATERKSRRRRRKKILMKNDGSLFDVTERRRISQAELRDYVRDGGLFEARRHETGADCTYEVLQSVMGAVGIQNLVPGFGSGSLPGIGAFPGIGGLADLARALGDHGDTGWDDREAPRRKPARGASDGSGWAEGEWPEDPQR